MLTVNIGEEFEPAKPWTNETIGSFVSLMVKNVFVLTGILCFVLLVFGGFSYLTANGEKDKIESSWHTIQYAIMGLIIIFVSYWLVQILALLTGSADLKNMLGL